ncbi:MAG TPA: alpha/beta hydrolase [Longimicrobium sp.]
MKIRTSLVLLPLAAACDRADAPLAPTTATPRHEMQFAAPTTAEGFVPSADGVSLFYHVEGSGPDTVLVMSGGPGLSYRYMAPDLGPLAHGRTVIYFDQRGSGRSTIVTDPAQLGPDRQVADIEAVRRHFGLAKMALAGHSSGAVFAVLYAASHPQNVERLVLLDPAPATGAFVEQFTANRIARTAPEQLARQIELMNLFLGGQVADPVAGCEELFHSIFRPYFADPQKVDGIRFCDVPVPAAANSVFALLVGMGALDASWDAAPYLQAIAAPTLVVHGSADVIPAASSAYYAQHLSDARLVTIENAGHFPWLEQPAAFFTTVDNFLRRGDVLR